MVGLMGKVRVWAPWRCAQPGLQDENDGFEFMYSIWLCAVSIS